MTKALVTGGAGFIGSHLVENLLSKGDKVRVLDNYSTGKKENLDKVRNDIENISGDVRSEADVQKAVSGIDVIYHLAAFVSVPASIEDPDQCFYVNVDGTIRLLTEALKEGIKRVVLASSAAVYGNNPHVPLKEDSELELLSPYAASKRVGELYTSIYSSILNLEVVALRFFNVYGPRQSPESEYAAAIPIFINNLIESEQPIIFGDGHQSRDFIFIEDVIRAIILAAETDQAVGKIINICSGAETTLLQLMDALSEIFQKPVNPRFTEKRPGDVYRSVGDPRRAKDILKFQPKVDIKKGLQIVAEWMAKDR